MKRNFFPFFLLLLTIGFFTSCKKEPAAKPDAARDDLMTAKASSERGQSFPPQTFSLRLASISAGNEPAISFSYDSKGRITKVVERSAKTYWRTLVTTYVYGSGTIEIKRFDSLDPDWYIMNLAGLVNSAGQVTSLKGALQSGDEFVDYSFTYENNRLKKLTRAEFDIHKTLRATVSTVFNWDTKGNLATSAVSSDGNWQETKFYTFNESQPDKRGLWNDIEGIWAQGLFGLRMQNMCTKKMTYKKGIATPTVVNQTWTLNLTQYPLSCSVSDAELSPNVILYKFNY